MTIQFIINHLWQSSCFVPLAGLLAFALRKNSPKVRYWVWLSASLKFLAPFALLVSLGSAVPGPERHGARSVPAPFFSNTLIQMAEPFSPAIYATVPAHAQLDWVPVAIGILWALGFVAIMLVRCRSWVCIRATLRASTPVDLPIPVPAFIAPGVEEPGVVGFLRPVLVLPTQLLEHLNPPQLDAVLAHELCHVRRRDNLFAAVHMLVEAVFWFHPLVWWIGSRMMEERELACDEEVLRMGCEPADYVEGILTVCRFYKEAPLPCVSGVTGADVKKRLRAVLAGSIAPELNTGGKAALTALGLAAVLVPIAIGALDSPTVNAQAPPSARSAVTARPAFEVASIRPCTKEDEAALADLEAAGGGRGGAGGPVGNAGRLRVVCGGLEVLIAQAYLTFPNGEAHYDRFGRPSVQGGPAWIEKERYTINAKPGSAQSFGMMHGPMMQALLEDRFKLKIHRGSEKVPAYALLVAKGGPKFQPTKGCPVDMPPDPRPPLGPGQTRPCGYQRFTDAGMDAYGWTMEQLSILLGSHMNRTVIDKTGITGAFDFHLDLPAPPPPLSPGIDDPNTPDLLGTVMDAMKKLGLKLERTKGAAEFVVIDHIERPTEN